MHSTNIQRFSSCHMREIVETWLRNETSTVTYILTDNLIMIWVVVRMQSPHYFLCKLTLNFGALAISNKYLCFISTLSFGWSTWSTHFWWMIPLSTNKVKHCSLRTLVTLSNLIPFTFLLNLVLIRAKKSTMILDTWPLLCNKNVQTTWYNHPKL